MRVLLINPPYSAQDRYGKDLGKFGPLNEPLGLAYLGAFLEKFDHEVTILDAPALGMTSEDICSTMEGKYDLIGITMLTPMYFRSLEVINAVKSEFPNIPVVVGGPHPTVLPEDTMTEIPEIDYAVIGEGEVPLRELADAIEKEIPVQSVPGIVYREDGQICRTPPAAAIENLDSIPIPARHLLPMHVYRMTRSRTRSGHSFTVSVARGCPFNCAFCCRVFGRKVRQHSVERIIEEARILVDEYGATEINLEADTLTVSKNFVHDLCSGFIDSGLSKRMTWTCESRVDTVTFEMLRHMKEAGCWQISYGVETGTQRLLDLIKKGITLEQIENTFAFTKKVGIKIRAFFMLGLPTETREDSLKTIDFARKLDAEWSQFTLFTPFPGAELYEMILQEGGLRSSQWADYKTHGGWTEGELSYVPDGRTSREMKELQKRAYRSVYLRPRVFLRMLKEVDSPGKLWQYLTGLLVLIKTLIRSKSNNKIQKG